MTDSGDKILFKYVAFSMKADHDWSGLPRREQKLNVQLPYSYLSKGVQGNVPIKPEDSCGLVITRDYARFWELGLFSGAALVDVFPCGYFGGRHDMINICDGVMEAAAIQKRVDVKK